jgi:hypothetical protein
MKKQVQKLKNMRTKSIKFGQGLAIVGFLITFINGGKYSIEGLLIALLGFVLFFFEIRHKDKKKMV